MSFSIDNLLSQIDSLTDLLRGENFYVIVLRENYTLGLYRKSSTKIARTIHSKDMKKLFEIYLIYFGNDLRTQRTDKLHYSEENLGCWSDVHGFRTEIMRLYKKIYAKYPEKLI